MLKQNRLPFLLLIHLLLLWYPQIIKSVHVHHNEPVCCLHDHGVSFDAPEILCPVCDFEFISFIGAIPTRLNACLPEIQVADLPVPESAYQHLLFYFSLRAPPIS